MMSEINCDNEMEEWNAFSTDPTMPFDGDWLVDGDNSVPSQGIQPGFQLDNPPVSSTGYGFVTLQRPVLISDRLPAHLEGPGATKVGTLAEEAYNRFSGLERSSDHHSYGWVPRDMMLDEYTEYQESGPMTTSDQLSNLDMPAWNHEHAEAITGLPVSMASSFAQAGSAVLEGANVEGAKR